MGEESFLVMPIDVLRKIDKIWITKVLFQVTEVYSMILIGTLTASLGDNGWY